MRRPRDRGSPRAAAALCTISVAVVPGSDNITVTLYDGSTTPKTLATTTTNVTIVQGSVNSPQITMKTVRGTNVTGTNGTLTVRSPIDATPQAT